MSKVDTAWLRMDSPSNLMMIVGVWILRPGITLAALSERVRDRLLPYNRFVQIARQDAAAPTGSMTRTSSSNATCARTNSHTGRASASRATCRRAWPNWPCSRWTTTTRCGDSS
ncbi:acyltransferase, WS/DGAT/MGAT [Hydrogenophaga sp. T4]|nr:acyltransferase, WS/DGAT/MGAT [Hydrogenophaga sp. T4]